MPSTIAPAPPLRTSAARRDYFLLAIALILLVISAKPTIRSDQHGDTVSSLDVCYINREISPRPPSSASLIPLSDGMLHNSSVMLLWFLIVLLCILPQQRLWALFTVLLSSIWFHTTYILLAALKAVRADFNCAGRHPFFPNGISGHYCYFIFVLLTTSRFTHARISANPSVSTTVLLGLSSLMSLFVIGAVATLYRTFFHGYHSPRQILLGTSLGLVSHVMLHVLHLAHPPSLLSVTSARPAIIVALSNSLVCFALYAVLWPHDSAGPAISFTQVIFHLALWLAILLTTQSLRSSVVKQATD